MLNYLPGKNPNDEDWIEEFERRDFEKGLDQPALSGSLLEVFCTVGAVFGLHFV